MRYVRIYDERDGDRFGLQRGGIYAKSLIDIVITELKKDGYDLPRYANINGMPKYEVGQAHVQETIHMQNLIGVKKYSEEYDRVMNLTFTIVRGAYCGTRDYTGEIQDNYRESKPFSIGIDPELTWVKDDVFESDGGYTHPVHDADWFDAKCIQLEVERDVLLDYPRHGNKLRYFFDSLEEATAVLYSWNQIIPELRKTKQTKTESEVA